MEPEEPRVIKEEKASLDDKEDNEQEEKDADETSTHPENARKSLTTLQL